jgi:hypothetical protein
MDIRSLLNRFLEVFDRPRKQGSEEIGLGTWMF